MEFTVKSKEVEEPKHPLIFGVTITLPVIEDPFGVVPPALNAVISLTPTAASPMDVLEFVQSNCVFGEPVKITVLKLDPSQTVWSTIGFTIGKGTNVITSVDAFGQAPEVKYVILYVPGVDDPKVILPEVLLSDIVAKLEVNVPFDVPKIVGVGLEASAQYLFEE